MLRIWKLIVLFCSTRECNLAGDHRRSVEAKNLDATGVLLQVMHTRRHVPA